MRDNRKPLSTLTRPPSLISCEASSAPSDAKFIIIVVHRSEGRVCGGRNAILVQNGSILIRPIQHANVSRNVRSDNSLEMN